MLNNSSGFEKIYICCGYSDLRKGIDGFASIIQQEFKEEVKAISAQQYKWLLNSYMIFLYFVTSSK